MKAPSDTDLLKQGKDTYQAQLQPMKSLHRNTL